MSHWESGSGPGGRFKSTRPGHFYLLFFRKFSRSEYLQEAAVKRPRVEILQEETSSG
jgi:hypothetical protein